MILRSTPVELYEHQGWNYWVKREDLCCESVGAPPFSKIRGLMKVLERLKDVGYTHVGYTETSISMAGWGVAFGCWKLGMKAVIFDPQYKGDHAGRGVLEYHRKMWRRFNAEIIPIKAGMARVNYNVARKILQQSYGDGAEMLPLGLPFQETILATVSEAVDTRLNSNIDFQTVVVNVGSGTIAAGVAIGFADRRIYGVMGRTGNFERKQRDICKKGKFVIRGMTGIDFELIDPGWEYTERCDVEVPFPCHPYYDAKAFDWMITEHYQLKDPVLFWNIGSLPTDEG